LRVPCVEQTSRTGLRPGRWTQRLVAIRKALGLEKGRLLQRNLSPPKLAEFEDDLFSILEKVQSETSEIEDDVHVREAYGILRSLWKGNTAHAMNMGVPEPLMRTFNRWRKAMEADMPVPSLDMIDLYASREAILPTLLRNSGPF
jgi:hypothetical protein